MIKDFRGRICCMIGCRYSYNRRRVGECSLSAYIYLKPSQRFRACWSRDWSFFSPPSPTFLHPTPSFPLPPPVLSGWHKDMFLVAGYGRFGRLLAFFFPLFSLATSEIILDLICERKLDLEIAAKLSGDQLTVKKKSMKSLDIDQLMNLKAHPIVHVLNYKFSSF